jgi:ABC-type sugar transport system permease subunit
MRSTLSQLAVVLGIGSFFVIIAFSIVAAAVADVMDDLDHGRQPSVTRTYRELWRNIADLFFARLRSGAIITLLGLTIIGLPWAIARIVRWAFVEWAVMVEEKRGREALEASAATVDGHWWRTLGVSAAVVAIGLGLGPIIGLALLLFTDWPLSTVNGVGSVLFLTLVPWTAVALSLLYYDLKARMLG